MNVINVTKQGNTNLTIGPKDIDPKDGQVQINTGVYSTANINITPGFNVQGVSGGQLSQGKTVTLHLNKYNSFYVVSGSFTLLNANTIPYANVVGAPGPITPIYFVTILNQQNYIFDGALTAWNPDGINLVGKSVPMFSTDGILKVSPANWIFDNVTGTLSILGKVYDAVQAILFYQ